MKKFLSIFVALAMVLSLFAGIGARSAKADSTFTVASSGNFFAGLDAVGATATDGEGTVQTATYASTTASVNVTTAAVGVFGATPNVTAYTVLAPSAYTDVVSTDTNWRYTGNQAIAISGAVNSTFVVYDVITVDGTTPGVGTFKYWITTPTEAAASSGLKKATAYIGVSTAIVGANEDTDGNRTGYISQVMRYVTADINSTDEDWRTIGVKTITFTSPVTLSVNETLDVYMDQLQPAVAAYSFLSLGGTVDIGDTASATWQDTTGVSHTASFVSTGETLAAVATGLATAINAVDGGLVTATTSGNIITVTQQVTGTVGNGKTLTGSTVASATALTVKTLGGLTQPGYVEVGKTIQLVATDSTGAIVAATWSIVADQTIATINSNGLVMAIATTGATVVTATYGTYEGTFVVVSIPTETITSLTVTLVPAALVVSGKQQFGAIATGAGYTLDYTTQAVWADTLPVAVISNAAPLQGLLTFSTDETGTVTAYAAGITATADVKITAGVVTLVVVVGPVTRVIVLTVGTDIVTVDGKATTVDAAPEIVNGRTFVPIRFIAETFGSTVTWLPETKGVTIVLGDTTIGLQIGNKTVVINGNIIAVEAAPYIKNSRTMVPLRVISESFGGDVAWDPALRTITITYVLPIA